MKTCYLIDFHLEYPHLITNLWETEIETERHFILFFCGIGGSKGAALTQTHMDHSFSISWIFRKIWHSFWSFLLFSTQTTVTPLPGMQISYKLIKICNLMYSFKLIQIYFIIFNLWFILYYVNLKKNNKYSFYSKTLNKFRYILVCIYRTHRLPYP